MSGCAICVQDMYAEALSEHKSAVDSLRTSLTSLNIPEDRWPASVRTTSGTSAAPKPNVAYDAFAELERQLEKKKKQEVSMARKTGVLRVTTTHRKDVSCRSVLNLHRCTCPPWCATSSTPESLESGGR